MNFMVLEQSVSWMLVLSVILLVTLATLSDLRSRRIPNRLVGPALLVALLEQCLQNGFLDGGLAWFFGAAIGMGLLLPGYLLRMMGAGDVKLMGAVGAFVGAAGALQIGLVSCAFGGVFSLVMMMRKHQLRTGLGNVRKWLFMAALQSRAASLGLMPAAYGLRESGLPSVGRLPFGLAIACGCACVLFASW